MIVAARQTSEFNLEIYQQYVAPPPRMRQDVERQTRHLGHRGNLVGSGDIGRDDLVGTNERIVIGVVLHEKLDHPRSQQHPARYRRVAFDERTGCDTANDHFERQHIAAAYDHLVVVVVFTAVEIVRRQSAEIEQAEYARGRLGG